MGSHQKEERRLLASMVLLTLHMPGQRGEKKIRDSSLSAKLPCIHFFHDPFNYST